MRLSAPPPFRLDRASLLRDVRARLAVHLPDWAHAQPDAADPAWLLLEQAAWMVETFSKRLDAWPLAAVQELLRLQGAELLPAQPALTVLALEPRGAGVLTQSPDHPPRWRAYAGQTETRGLIEFVPVEAEIPLRTAVASSLCRWQDGELVRVDRAEGETLMVGEPERIDSFHGEIIELVARVAAPEDTRKRLRAAIDQLGARRLGWLGLDVHAGDGEVRLSMWIDPAGVFGRTAPGGRAPGGDLVGDVGVLDAPVWSPPLVIGPHAEVPARWRGRAPLPGPTPDTILVPDVRREAPVAGLLRRRAVPLPDGVVDGVWRMLTGVDTSLAGLQPRRIRRLGAPGPRDPAWLSGAPGPGGSSTSAGLDGRMWADLASCVGDLLHVRLDPRQSGPLRLALIGTQRLGGPSEGGLRAWGLSTSNAGPLTPTERGWTLPVAPDDVMVHTLRLDPGVSGVLIELPRGTRGVFLNPALVINTPTVPDGREVLIRRSTPEEIVLGARDLVTRPVLDGLAADVLAGDPGGVAALLGQLPLGRVEVGVGEAGAGGSGAGRAGANSAGSGPGSPETLPDLEGVSLDPVAGRLTTNSPDHRGQLREFLPGARLRLGWYRRTDGAAGNVEAGAVRFVEHGAELSPALTRVRNPVAASLGRDREREDAAKQRLFGAGAAEPVVPADWERLVLRALAGVPGELSVRVWGYAERSLHAWRLWPLGGADRERDQLAEVLRLAGPDVLVVLVGRPGGLDAAALTQARRAINGLIAQENRRFRVFSRAEVAELHLLTLAGAGTSRAASSTVPSSTVPSPTHPSLTLPGPTLPSHSLDGLDGELRDAYGRHAPSPGVGRLLNARVIPDVPVGGWSRPGNTR